MTMSPNSATPAALELNSATKSFGAVAALTDGTIEIRPGEIHALVAENGAGKSTLVKILAGVFQPDSGRFTVDGEDVSFRSPADRVRRQQHRRVQLLNRPLSRAGPPGSGEHPLTLAETR